MAVVERLRTRRGVARWEAVACGGVCDVEIDAEDGICLVPRVGGSGGSTGLSSSSSSGSDSDGGDADGEGRGGGRQRTWRIKDVVRVTPPEDSRAARDPACPDPPLTLWGVDGASWRLHFCQGGDAATWTAWATAALARRDWHAAATTALERLAPALAALGVQVAVHADLDTPATNGVVAVAVQTYPTPTAHGAITATPPSWADVCQGAHVLQCVLALYTPAVMRASGIRTVALVRTLAFDGARRQAVPDLATGTLHVALEAAAVDARYLRRMVHHELFHFLDYACSPEGLYTDTAWTALNAPGVRYAGGPHGAGARHQHQPVVHAWDAALVSTPGADRPLLPPGIVSSYCLTGVEEDKAELFAYRMCHPRRLARLCAADAVLARKCAALAAFVDGLNGGLPFFPEAAVRRKAPATEVHEARGAAPPPADATYYGSLLVLSANASDWT